MQTITAEDLLTVVYVIVDDWYQAKGKKRYTLYVEVGMALICIAAYPDPQILAAILYVCDS